MSIKLLNKTTDLAIMFRKVNDVYNAVHERWVMDFNVLVNDQPENNIAAVRVNWCYSNLSEV